LLNGSRGAILQALAAFPDLVIIHITAPLTILADRLDARGREARGDIEARLGRANLSFDTNLPVIGIVNDASLQTGVARLLQALRA
jgi:ribose 1,5-bisphosphokinase PhnN